MMSFRRFFMLIISLYVAALFLGAAITQRDLVCLAGSSIWVGVALIIFPVFRKKSEEVDE